PRLRGHHRTDADAVRPDRERREQRPCLEAVGVDRILREEEVIGQPEPAKTGGLAIARDREDVLEPEPELRLDLDPEVHHLSFLIAGEVSPATPLRRRL